MSTKKTEPQESHLDQKLAELREYNEKHHTRLTYGKYQAMLYQEQQRKLRQQKRIISKAADTIADDRKHMMAMHIASQDLIENEDFLRKEDNIIHYDFQPAKT